MENRKSQEEIEKTLNSLEGLRRAESPELLFEKVSMRLNHPQARIIRVSPRRVLQAAACLAAIVLINVFVWLKTSGTASTETQQNNPLAQEYFSYLNSTITF